MRGAISTMSSGRGRLWKTRALMLVLFALVCLDGSAQDPRSTSFPASSIDGFWRFADDGSVVLMKDCEGAVCAILSGLPESFLRDRKARSICGLKILSGFVPHGSDSWRGGQVFDPASSELYTGVLRRISPEQLELIVVAGPLSIRQRMVRHTGPVHGCVAAL